MLDMIFVRLSKAHRIEHMRAGIAALSPSHGGSYSALSARLGSLGVLVFVTVRGPERDLGNSPACRA